MAIYGGGETERGRGIAGEDAAGMGIVGKAGKAGKAGLPSGDRLMERKDQALIVLLLCKSNRLLLVDFT